MTYALLVGCGSAVATALLGAPFVAWLRARKLGKAISDEGPQSHLSKEGTPTMGGLLIMAVWLGAAFVAGVPKDRDVLLPVAVGALFAVIGTYDDLGTLVGRGKRDAHDRMLMVAKVLAFAVVGVVSAWLLYDRIDAPRLLVPHYGAYDIGPVYVLVAIGLIVALTSGVGVTDGLDMLLSSTGALAFSAFGAIALVQRDTALATICFAMVGALLGFLYWNAYPARVFMGDSGSLPLGGILSLVALMSGWWLLVPVIGVVFVLNILADVLQIGSFRLTGRRVLRMAPLHHHFEQIGWNEVTVTARFAALGAIGAIAGVALAALR